MRTLIALFVCAAALSAAGPQEQASRRAPGFALMDSKMKIHDLQDYRGKPVILEFMLTTCPHCAALIPVLQKIEQKYGDKVGIIAVVNPPDNFNTVDAFISGHGIKYPILFDSGQMAYSYMLKMRFDQPQLFVIDANGKIVSHYDYSPMTRDIFEGNGLINEMDRLVAPGKK